jgi:hypothetical protein
MAAPVSPGGTGPGKLGRRSAPALWLNPHRQTSYGRTARSEMAGAARRKHGGLGVRTAGGEPSQGSGRWAIRCSGTERQAEESVHQALAMTHRPLTKLPELQAAMRLARLWQQHGRRAEAYDLLAPIYGWFTEGFDTADLQEAKALLEELS